MEAEPKEVEEVEALNPSNVTAYIREFEDTYFWRHVMRPAMVGNIRNMKNALVWAKSISEIREFQASIRATQVWIGFPNKKRFEVTQAAEFDRQKEVTDDDNEAEE
jgi:hypothetical protein